MSWLLDDLKMTATMEPLRQELQTYETHREQLLGEAQGKYVLIRSDAVVATYDTEQDAIKEGYRQFGNVPFLVKRITALDEPANFLSPVASF
jgi:hypothetical protein